MKPLLRRASAVLLCCALVHSVVGPSLCAAWAQVRAAAVSAPSSALSVVPVLALPGTGAGLSAPAAPGRLSGTVLPNAAVPGLRLAAPSAAPAPRPALPAPTARSPIALFAPRTAALGVRASPAPSSAPEASARAPESVSESLVGVGGLARESARGSAETSALGFSRFYDAGRARASTAEAVEAPSDEGERASRLAPSRSEDGGTPSAEPPAAPVRSLSRAAKYGYVAGILSLVMIFGAQALGAALGYVPHSDYQAPSLSASPSLTEISSLVLMVSVFAPIVEELVFRAGLLDGLEKLAKRFTGRWAGLLAGVLSSGIFVVLHETSDPLLIGVRMLDALLMSWVYKREGLTASIVQHAVHNGLMAAGMVASLLLGSGAGAFMAVVGLANLAAAAVFGRGLWKQRADRREGRILRHELTPWVARTLALLLGASALFFSGPLVKISLGIAAVLFLYSLLQPKDMDAVGRL